MKEHPEELLADFASGDLRGEDRRAVEAHVASCARCAEEVALSRRAVTSLSRLEEVPAPAGLATPAIQRARPQSRWQTRVGWAAASAAAAALIAIFAISQIGSNHLSADTEAGPAQGVENAPLFPPAPAASNGGQIYVQSNHDYTRTELQALARSAQRSSVKYGANSPQPQASSGDHLLAVADQAAAAQRALECAQRAGLTAGENAELLRIEAANFEGTAVYIVLFAVGANTEVWVVDRRDCQIRYVATSQS